MTISAPTEAELRKLYLQLDPNEAGHPRIPKIPPLSLSDEVFDELEQLILNRSPRHSPYWVRKTLNEAAEFFVNDLWHQGAPPPSLVERELKTLASAARKIEKSLYRDARHDGGQMQHKVHGWLQFSADAYGLKVGKPEGLLLPDLRYGFWTSQKLASVFQSVSLLAHLADEAAQSVRREHAVAKRGTPRGHAKRPALRLLIHRLALAWLYATGVAPGGGFNAYVSKADGPFIRFALAFMRALRRAITREHEAYLPTIRKELGITSDGIRAHLKVFHGRLTSETKRQRPMAKSLQSKQ